MESCESCYAQPADIYKRDLARVARDKRCGFGQGDRTFNGDVQERTEREERATSEALGGFPKGKRTQYIDEARASASLYSNELRYRASMHVWYEWPGFFRGYRDILRGYVAREHYDWRYQFNGDVSVEAGSSDGVTPSDGSPRPFHRPGVQTLPK